MKRRDFMLAAGTAAGALMLPRMAFAEQGRIDWYTSSDQNVLDFWTNVVKPKFEAANPGITINLVDGGDNAGLQAIAERAPAALGPTAHPQTHILQRFPPPPGGGAAKARPGGRSPNAPPPPSPPALTRKPTSSRASMPASRSAPLTR